VLVDNASTDATLEVVNSTWGQKPITSLRIVQEDQLGLVYARIRGLAEAKYEIISFIDDDNRVAENWVDTAYQLMTSNPQIGVCGSLNTPVFESAAPAWFSQFQNSYAVGPQAKKSGDTAEDHGVIWGAGLTLRKSAWEHLVSNGFEFQLIGRQGESLLSGEDHELCLAIKLAGWEAWYVPSLRLEHYIPSFRLDWMHLRKMVRGYGFTKLRLKAYGYMTEGLPKEPHASWIKLALAKSREILRWPVKALMMQFFPYEGDRDVIILEMLFGELAEIVKFRETYVEYFHHVANAEWVKT
jgi:glycosyltransferase involved in cell wall biosynthesis